MHSGIAPGGAFKYRAVAFGVLTFFFTYTARSAVSVAREWVIVLPPCSGYRPSVDV